MVIEIKFPNPKAPDLNLLELLLLSYLYEIPEHLPSDELSLPIIAALEEKEYLRVVNEIAVLDIKGVSLFENDYTNGAKEVLDYMNKLKSDLNISKIPFQLRTHGKELVARLSEGNSIETIKLVIEYKYNQWIGTEWQKYLRPSTLFNKTKFYNYIEEVEMNKVRLTSSLHEMV